MQHNIKELYGAKLAATDGDIGHIKDFYFDDKRWVVRYLVANTGSWLTGRLVLLTPHCFGRWDASGRILPVKLTRKQIEDSPSINSHRPVSRQYEQAYYDYYGWPAYWQGGGTWGADDHPFAVAPPMPRDPSHHGHNQRDDLHLRSTKDLTGYNIRATDGMIGFVSGFRVDDTSWAINGLSVETGHWYAGKEVLVAPDRIEEISNEDSRVQVALTKAEIQQTANQAAVHAGT